MVFAAFKDAGVKICLEKSHFFLRNKVTLFGFTINLSLHSIQPDIKKVDAILKLLPPTSKKEVKSFLGKIQYFYRLIPGVNSWLDPLFKLSSQKTPFVWTTDCQEAFVHVKRMLARGPQIFVPFVHNLYK